MGSRRRVLLGLASVLFGTAAWPPGFKVSFAAEPRPPVGVEPPPPVTADEAKDGKPAATPAPTISPEALAKAREELLAEFESPVVRETHPDFAAAQREREENALARLRPVDAVFRVFLSKGATPKDIGVRAFHPKLDLTTATAMTDEKGQATLRLPPGRWELNLSGHVDADHVVFGRTFVDVPVRGQRAFDLPLLHTTKVRFRDTGNAPSTPERVDLACEDLLHRFTWRGERSHLTVLRPSNLPLVVQMLRTPTQRPGYLIRATTIASAFDLTARGSDATRFVFPGSPLVKLSPSIDSMDALSAPFTFESRRKETLVIRGLPELAVGYSVNAAGKKYRFYTTPVLVDGKDRTFSGRAPFDVSVGTYWASPSRFKGHRYKVSARVFLRDANGLIMVGHSKRAPFPVKWRALLHGKEFSAGTMKGAWSVRMAALKKKPDYLALKFELELSDTGRPRRLSVDPQLHKQLATVGRVQLQTLPQLEPNARAWARWVNDLADSFAETQHQRPRNVTYCLWVHAMPGLSGWGGWSSGGAWGYFRDGHIFGYARSSKRNNGTASHEMTHGHHVWAHGTVFNQTQTRALRRMWSRRTDGLRVPGGQRHLPWLEALPEVVAAEPETGIPIGARSSEDPKVAEDEVIAWYVRQMFGVKACNDARYHLEFHRWWLTLQGFTDDEARAGVLQHMTKTNLAWLVRQRGGAVSDRRSDEAALVASNPKKVKRPVKKIRSAAVTRWKDPDLTKAPDLDIALSVMDGELGQWSSRSKVYLKAAKLTAARGDRRATKRYVLEALRCGARLGRTWFDRALEAGAPIWASVM